MALTREILLFSRLGSVNNSIKINLNSCNQCTPLLIPVRGIKKHYIPKWKWLRSQKTIPIELPDYHLKGAEKRERIRTKLKELGIESPRFWKERPITITSIPNIIDPYKPPAGDGKSSFLLKTGAKDVMSNLNKKKNTMLAIRKIKSYDENFDVKLFPQHAQDVYIKAHECLMKRDPEELIEFATERCLTEMLDGVKQQTIRWKFIKSLEPPIVVQARTANLITETNYFAQVTVRFHSQQMLAIYDRFGRLMYGSELVPKDVLEYVVFEKHIINVYGVWRIHSKIIPEWSSPAEPSAKTYVVSQESPEEEEEEEDDENIFSNLKDDENFSAAQNLKKGIETEEAGK